jgi:hypothetical protein
MSDNQLVERRRFLPPCKWNFPMGRAIINGKLIRDPSETIRATHQFEYAQPLPRRRGGVILPTPVKADAGLGSRSGTRLGDLSAPIRRTATGVRLTFPVPLWQSEIVCVIDLRVKPRDPEASIRVALRDVQCPRCNGYGRPRIIALAPARKPWHPRSKSVTVLNRPRSRSYRTR